MIVGVVAAALVLANNALNLSSTKLSFIDSHASAPCESYTSSSSCTGSKACEWYGSPATCHIPSCGGLLNVSGKSSKNGYEGGCFTSSVPSGQGWVYAGFTNDCGAVAGNSSKGCFYRPLQSTGIATDAQVNPKLDSCGGTLNKLGKANPSQYTAGCFWGRVPANQGWIYAGQTNDCGSVANDQSKGCFYKPVGSSVPAASSAPSKTQSPTSSNPTPSTSVTPFVPTGSGGGAQLGVTCKASSQCGGYSCIQGGTNLDGPGPGNGDVKAEYKACGGVFASGGGPCGALGYYSPALNGPNFRTNLNVSPSPVGTVRKGSNITFTAEMIFQGKVMGSDHPTVDAVWYQDGVEIGRGTYAIPGQSQTQTVTKTVTADAKWHTIKFVIDPDNRLFEYSPVCNGKSPPDNSGETDNSSELYNRWGI